MKNQRLYFDDITYNIACAKLRLRTLKEQAEHLGVSESYAGQITRRGAIPGPRTRARIAQVLGLQEVDLWAPQGGIGR